MRNVYQRSLLAGLPPWILAIGFVAFVTLRGDAQAPAPLAQPNQMVA